ncbi:phospholipase D-like domain-containing protein [Clostridium sp.]|nr:phospholipase D-like domain-containing protein [Clostridium sp.]
MKKNNVIDESKKELLRELLNYSDEYLFEELTPRTLKKMHNFLVEHKCAETFKEIKSKNQINIKGCGPNGLERLIGKEIREQYGLDILEASEKFTTFYPIFSEGVIKYESVNGLHYTHFKVSGQTEKTFGMEIKEYKLYHNVFYLTYSIRIKEMSKHIPFYLSETVGEDIRHLLFSGPLSEEVDKEFSELEKLMIRHTINNEQNYEEEITIILYNTIANFRAVNFLWEKYNHDLLLHSISSDWFYDNDFFKINNWRYEIQGINDLDELYQKRLEDYCDYILNSKDDMMVLRKNTIDSVINGIVRKANITKLYAATGFVFSSGLRLLQESLNIINDRNGKCRIVAGSLNSCANENVNNKIDKTTVNYLNALIRDKKIELYSYIGAFYHGKFYYLCNEDYAYIIIGSSNISKTAFRNNFELDILHKVKLGSSQDKLFSNWFNGFISQCDKITNLDEKQFEDFNWNNELDVFKPLNRKIVSSNEIKKRIAALTDEETQFRLNIWMDYRPDIICDDISIEALKSYTMFAFLEEELVVFESFKPQNAFYVFGCPNGLENLINSIAKLTKSQMTLSKWYVDRGNHISNRKSLQQRISRLFKL